MSKIIIPKSELPELSTSLTNKLRYRIMNKNRNLFSDWSIISEIKRDLQEIDFYSASSSYSIYSEGNNRIAASWYTNNINQNYDIYVRYILKTITEGSAATLYSSDPLEFLGQKNTNSLTLAIKPTLASINSLSYVGVQLMVKLPEYPRISSSPIGISTVRRKDNQLQYMLERSHLLSVGDYVNINMNNNITYGSEVDYSLFGGIKQVTSISPNGVNSFGVSAIGSDTAFITPPTIQGYLNTVEKINGTVLFAGNSAVPSGANNATQVNVSALFTP